MKKTIILSTISLVAFITATAQQWTTSGNNITNTNTGTVVILATSPTGGQKLVVNPLGAGTITLGEGNTGSGSYTSLTFGISAYQNGYSTIQSIKSAGSAHGVLSLNPSGGGVAIGTTDPGNFKLAVEGKIGARELKVTLTSPWPDYVFKPGYKLPNLSEVEKHIRMHNHLPGMPSALEVEQNNGIELGDMSKRLLEKVEELTLYVIALKKENDQIKEQLKKLSDKK
jgi:hypothetical protein